MSKQLLVMGVFFISNVFWAQTNRLWKETSQKTTSEVFENKTGIRNPKVYNLDFEGLKKALVKAPQKFGKSDVVVSFPNSNGTFEDFKVRENSNFAPELAAQYPEIKSYVGVGLDDASSTVYFSMSPLGLSSMELYGNKSAVFIEPYTKDLSSYVVYKKSDKRESLDKFECTVIDVAQKGMQNSNLTAKPNADDGKLRTFRLALSCTGEYTTYFGGTVAGALAAMNNTMTRVNGVFEKDFAARMVMIANNNSVIYTNASTDPYSASAQMANWNTQLQNTLTSVIGEANYDIGHLFGATGGGGNAGCIGCVCTNGTKGRGYTSPADGIPSGDNFDIDYVAHEMGHQFGGNHTFSNNIEGTGVNVEPGGGSTIMAYAGITNYNVQMHSDPFFHAISIQQITNNIKTKTCPVITDTGNAIPTADAGADYIIPKGTPFILTGTGTDANNNDTLTYIWEQMDTATNAQTGANSAASATKTAGPTFRSYTPQAVPSRYFPSLDRVLMGATTSSSPIGTASPIVVEALSNVARTYNFRFTTRDNRAGGSGNNSDDMAVTVNAGAGPFLVTSQNTAGVVWNEGQVYTITWDVANTTTAPISSPNVTILLSKDGGLTWPTILVATTPNNGSYTYTVPGGLGNIANARIMVKSSNNIFFNVNLKDFVINSSAVVLPPVVPPPVKVYQGAIVYPVPSYDGNVYIKLDYPRLIPQAPYSFSYTVYAMDGKLVLPKRNRLFFAEHLEKIDLTHLPTETYMLELEVAGERIVKKLLMLRK